MNCQVSIIMSIYNEEIEWIEHAIDSILYQTYKNIQYIIVVDNPYIGEEIKDYLEKISLRDPRVEVIYNECNLGLACSLNIGITLAKGKYIARMDADDISLPERIEEQVNYFQNDSVDVVGTGRYLINENGSIIGGYIPPIIDPGKIKKILPITSCIIHPTVMIKTDVLKAVGGYRNFRQSQDYDLWLRLLSDGYKFSNINKPLLKYRIRDNGISIKKPYLQYCTSQYQRHLLKMRVRTGKDSFSEDNFQKYLRRHNALGEEKNRNYIITLHILEAGIHDLKYKKISGIFKLIQSIIIFPEMFGVLYKKTKGLMLIRE